MYSTSSSTSGSLPASRAAAYRLWKATWSPTSVSDPNPTCSKAHQVPAVLEVSMTDSIEARMLRRDRSAAGPLQPPGASAREVPLVHVSVRVFRPFVRVDGARGVNYGATPATRRNGRASYGSDVRTMAS
jgi:hypothetical protein